MESASVLKRTRRRSKDSLVPGQPDQDDDHDDEISRLIARGRLLRDRMDLASSMDLGDCNRPGSSTTLELDVLGNVPDGATDPEVLFANLFFDQEGADAVAVARQRKRQSLQEIRQAQDDARQALIDIGGLEQPMIAARLTLSQIVFDRRFPFASSRPTVNVSFTIPNQKNIRGSAVSSLSPKFFQSKCLFQIDEAFSLTLPKSIFEAQDNYIQFTVKCECEGQLPSKPKWASMSGFLSLYRLLDSGQGSIGRETELISRNRQHRCTLKFELLLRDEGRQLEPSSDAADAVQYDRPPTPRIAQGVVQVAPEPAPEPIDIPAPIDDLPELAARPGDLVIVQVGIRSAVVTLPLPQRQRYLFVSYQAFPGQTRHRTVPSSDRWCPSFDHLGQIPRLYSQQFYDHLKTSLLVLEFWTCSSPRPREDQHSRLLGIAKIRLDRILPSLNQGGFCKEASGGDVFAALRLCGFSGDIEARDVISNQTVGRLSVMLALGSLSQMSFLGELWRAAVPIQRVVRGFLCRKRLPGNIDPISKRHKDADNTSDLMVEPVRESKFDIVGDNARSSSMSPESVGRRHDDGSPHRYETHSSISISRDRDQLESMAKHDFNNSELVPSLEESCLTIECQQAANLSDPNLFTGSLYVKFAFDPLPSSPHQSGLSTTHLIPGCSHPNWKSRVRLNSKALPTPIELLQKTLLFSLHYRSNDEPKLDYCLGRARFSLRKLTVATAENGILEWLDIISDSNQCIGHLLVKILPNEIMLSALCEAQLEMPIAAIREPQPDFEPPPERSISDATQMDPITPDSFRFSASTFLSDLDYAPVQDFSYTPTSYTDPNVTMEDVNLKLKEIGDIKNSYRRPSATIQDLSLKMKELDKVKTRLENFQSQSLPTNSEYDRAGTRLRSAMIFTPNPTMTKPSSIRIPSGPLPQPDRDASLTIRPLSSEDNRDASPTIGPPSSADNPIEVSATSRSPGKRSSLPTESSTRSPASPVKSPGRAPSSPAKSPGRAASPVKSPGRAPSSPVKSPGRPVRSPKRAASSPIRLPSPTRILINIMDTMDDAHTIVLEHSRVSDREASVDAFERDIIDVVISNIDLPPKPPIYRQNEVPEIEGDMIAEGAPVPDEEQADSIPLEHDQAVSISESDYDGHGLDEVENDLLPQNSINVDASIAQDDSHYDLQNTPELHTNPEIVHMKPNENNVVGDQQGSDNSSETESVLLANQPDQMIGNSHDTASADESDLDDQILTFPTHEDQSPTDSKLGPPISSPKSEWKSQQEVAPNVREVALSPIRVLPDPSNAELLITTQVQNDGDVIHSSSDYETPFESVGLNDVSACDNTSVVRSCSTSPVKSSSLLRRRVNLSYSTSPVTSRESSPGHVSDSISYQSDGDDVDSGIRMSRRSARDLSPRTTVGLPPLPPKPRPQMGRLVGSTEERKRYERIARIFEGKF